eukprot:6814317-Alexandrium_andersonii.AAC.1
MRQCRPGERAIGRPFVIRVRRPLITSSAQGHEFRRPGPCVSKSPRARNATRKHGWPAANARIKVTLHARGLGSHINL